MWVRGYGLVDSPKVAATPGKTLDLKAVPAPSAAAAQYYPAIYWYLLLKIPPKSDFPGTGAKGNDIMEAIKTQYEWLNTIKTNGCNSCHAMGTPGTRVMPKDFAHMTSYDAWARRIASGQAVTNMVNTVGGIGTEKSLTLFADWTDRIAAGELPFDKPQRPQGIERNVVLTLWDWSRNTICTISWARIAASRRSTPTANSTAPPSSARTMCRYSIRRAMPPRKCFIRCAIRKRPRTVMIRWRRRRIGATSRSGMRRPAITIR